MPEHKHAEVLRAIADGKEVQWKSFSTGEWCDVAYGAKVNPVIDTHLEWRIKPEPFAWLEDEDFYDVCQAYRHATDGLTKSVNACEAFESLKFYIRRKVSEMNDTTA